MGDLVAAFLNEVVQFLEDEILLDAYTNTRYFDKCEIRVDLDAEYVKIRFLSHCMRDHNGQILRVNDILNRSEIRLEFQFPGQQITGSWTESLTQCTIGLHVPNISTPFVFKWEARDKSGVLKADEWFDRDREFIAQEISAKDAIEKAIFEHLKTTVPNLQEQTSVTPVSPLRIKVLYNDDHEILEELDPIRPN